MRRAALQRAIIPILLCGTFLFVAVGLMMNHTSNCGGNSAALIACSAYVNNLGRWNESHPNSSPFHDTLSVDQKRELFHLPGMSWLRTAHFWVDPAIHTIDPTAPRKVAIVCDRPYSNVPQYTSWIMPPRHAVAYSTGEVELLGTDAFARIDRSQFVDLRTLFDPASVPAGEPARLQTAPPGSEHTASTSRR